MGKTTRAAAAEHERSPRFVGGPSHRRFARRIALGITGAELCATAKNRCARNNGDAQKRASPIQQIACVNYSPRVLWHVPTELAAPLHSAVR